MRMNILKISLIISSPLLKLRRKIGDNPSLTTYVMGYFQKIQEEELTYVVVHLVSFTTWIHYIEDHSRERKKRFKLYKTLRSMWITSIWTKTSFSHKEDRVLLANHGERLLILCQEMRCLLISCEFYSSATRSIAPNHRILAIWRLGTGYCRTITKVFWWTLVHLGCNWLLFKMGWSCRSSRGEERECCKFYPSEYHLSFWYPSLHNN